MMNCQQARELMIESSATAPLLPELEEHLATCAECTSVHNTQLRARQALRSLPWPEPPPLLEGRLRAIGQAGTGAGIVGTPEAVGGASDFGLPSSRARGTRTGSVRRWLARSLRQSLRQPAPPPARGAAWHWPELALLAVAAALAAILFAGRRTVSPTPPQPASAATPTTVSTAVLEQGYPTLAALPTMAPTVVPPELKTPIRDVVYTGWRGSPPDYGRRPYHTTVEAGAAWTIEHGRRCRLVWLDFGDGTIEKMPCPEWPTDAYPGWPDSTPYSTSHTFERAGMYHPQLKMAVDDGTLIVQPVTAVLVFDTPASFGRTGLVTRLLAWMALAGAALLVLFWALSLGHPARQRRTGCFAVTLALVALVVLAPADRTALLQPYLNALIGQTGLDPLDPGAPLVSYEFSWASRWLPWGQSWVNAAFTYADGSRRSYDIPVEFGQYFGGGRLRDGLGRLRTEHRELPGLPFAKEEDGVRLGIPRRLGVHPDAERLSTHRRVWLGADCRPSSILRAAPDGSAFLVAGPVEPSGNTLWLVPFDGRPPVQVAQGVLDFLWSPDSRYVVMTYPAMGDPRGETAVTSFDVQANERREIKRLPPGSRPSVNADGVWYVTNPGNAIVEVVGAEVWLAPYDGGPAQRLLTQPGAAFIPRNVESRDVAGWPNPNFSGSPMVQPSPDGRWVAYSCRGGTCLLDIANDDGVVVDIRAEELAWSPDGNLLAAVSIGEGTSPQAYAALGNWQLNLTIIPRDGSERRRIGLGPAGKFLSPQWTPDSTRLFLTTCPYDGRRVLTVDAESGNALDLSQPRWDAWAALMPSGDQLLLSNGRGGYWVVDVVLR